MWKVLIIVGAVLLAGYRVWSLRRRGVPVATALGFGLDRRPFVNLAVGAVISALAMSAIFLLEWSSGLLAVTHMSPATALIHDISSFIAVPLIEEFLFRCALLGGLLLLVRPPVVAVAISAALFGGLHSVNANASALSVLSTTLGGLAYGIAFAATERIWLPLGLHFGWNYTQARVFGFSISGGPVRGLAPFVLQHDFGPAMFTGGAYGPEGGVIGLGARVLVIALVVAWLMFERRRRDHSAGSETNNRVATEEPS